MPSTVAILHREGGITGVSFPDFPGVVATGRTAEEAVRRASETLGFHVAGMVAEGDAIPLSRSVEELERDAAFREDAEGAVLALVSYELPTRAVRINVTVEESLLGAIDRAAKASGQSRSAFLAEAARLRMRG